MTAFQRGYFEEFRKLAYFLPTLKYTTPQDDKAEQPPPFKKCLETAARQVFNIPDPNAPQWNGYGVGITRPGDKQVSPPYMSEDPKAKNAANNLQKKWSVPGLKPTSVGTGTIASPRRNLSYLKGTPDAK